jgi:hypothetical protein
MTDTVRLAASKTERVRLDASTTVASDHHYGAAVSAARPDLARMHSTTEITVERPVGRTKLVARTVTTAHALSVDVDITVDGQPFWQRRWNHRPALTGGASRSAPPDQRPTAIDTTSAPQRLAIGPAMATFASAMLTL